MVNAHRSPKYPYLRGNRGRRIQRRSRKCWIEFVDGCTIIIDLINKADNDWRDVGWPSSCNASRLSPFLHCVQKRIRSNVLFVISFTKLWRLRWNLVQSFLNKYCVSKSCKRFSPHLNNVSTLKLEMLIAHVLYHWVVIERNSEFIPPELWPPNSPHLNPVDYSL